MAVSPTDDPLGNLDHRRALLLLSHGVRTGALRRRELRERDVEHSFIVFRR